MKVLITGGGGFVGSHLGDMLLADGHEVFAMDISKDYKVAHNLNNPRFHYVKASIFDNDILERLINKCDLVYHLAAMVGVEHYVGDPLAVLKTNVEGTINVIKSIMKFDKKLVFSSTSEVYGRNMKVPWKEDDDRVLGSTRIDRWCYSTSKAVGEHYCFAYMNLGLKPVITRYFNVYGPRLDAIDVGRVITIFMGQILRGQPLTVIGDGKQTRCFTYVTDAVRATIKAGMDDSVIGQVINIGNDREYTVLELARTMCKIAGRDPDKNIKFVKQEEIYGQRYEDIPRRVPDITKMRSLLKVEPSTTLEQGLRETYDYFLKEFRARA
jgi:UDP-glucose 4-epimerase